MFKKPNNSILTLQQIKFLVNLELNWWGIMTTPEWKISRKDSCSFCPIYRNARHRSRFDKNMIGIVSNVLFKLMIDYS